MFIKKNRNENIYIFIKNINNDLYKKILNFKNIAIIYDGDKPAEVVKIIKFFSKHHIKIFILDNFKLAKKFNLNGVVLSHNNKSNSIFSSFSNNKKLEIIGKAHNQLEYYFKIRQNCKNIFLSPLFKNEKYNESKILNISKFNLITINWKIELFALGGINNNNYKKLKMTKAKGYGFISFIEDPQIKKPAYFLSRRAF
jgi:thiamine-phosphate pyrophosphorylase